MLESATEFTIVARWQGKNRHDVLAPGQRKPIARMEKVERDKHGRKINTDLLQVSVGPDFEHVIGYVGPGRAWTSARQVIGHTLLEDEGREWPSERGEFEQNGLGVLYREALSAKPNRLARAMRNMRAIGPVLRDCAAQQTRYRNSDSAGFSLTKPRGVSMRCNFVVHDERVDRILLMACYLGEMRAGKLIGIGGKILVGTMRVAENR